MAGSGIVLFAKRPGITSFASLNTIKKSLGTKKVGHTGTLDAFAQGLLVVCVGALTRLAGVISGFDKTYDAVIEFGSQTDTLDPSGEAVETAPLPTLKSLEDALEKFKGRTMQSPPEFSAIKIGGKRASSLARGGGEVKIPKREIVVYDYSLKEVKCEGDGIKYALVNFVVSKGTYIRSLARDIAIEAKSRAHLAGLLRTRVGDFSLSDAALFSRLEPFDIESVVRSLPKNSAQGVPSGADDFDEAKREIVSKTQGLSFDLARALGLEPVTIDARREADFFNGRPLQMNMFDFSRGGKGGAHCKVGASFGGASTTAGLCDKAGASSTAGASTVPARKLAVFSKSAGFCGVVSAAQNKIGYDFVIPKEK